MPGTSNMYHLSSNISTFVSDQGKIWGIAFWATLVYLPATEGACVYSGVTLTAVKTLSLTLNLEIHYNLFVSQYSEFFIVLFDVA
jgi:hypothetical protein